MNTRKKTVKTVYVDEDDSEAEKEAGDFSDSGSDAKISDEDHYSSEDEAVSDASAEDFVEKLTKKSSSKPKPTLLRPGRKTKFAKNFISKIQKQTPTENEDYVAPEFSVKDLTDADKLLPPVLNLSDSDSSDDESPKPSNKHNLVSRDVAKGNNESDSEEETNNEYKDVWSSNMQDAEEVAKRTFMELEEHKTKIEETKASLLNYSAKSSNEGEFDVNVLLAQGEVLSKPSTVTKGKKGRKVKDDSESEVEDWEEVKDAKPIPQQGLQLIVDFPDAVSRKTKKLDVEMMMKRKINRVKKEYQVFMHKVHVLCWIGHGNYISRVLNDQDILAATLSLVPSKSCYPGERVDMKYVEQITTWFKDKLTLKQDKNEDKFKPKAPPLKEILLSQLKTRVVTNKKYLVFVFVSMLRALGLQCRVMFNFVTLPIKPPSTELCSLSTKPKNAKSGDQENNTNKESKGKGKKTKTTSKTEKKAKIPQLDGANDEINDSGDDEYENIVQVDGNDDNLTDKPMRTRSLTTRKPVKESSSNKDTPPKRGRSPKMEKPNAASPPKKIRKSPSPRTVKASTTENKSETESTNIPKRSPSPRTVKASSTENKSETESTKIPKRSPSPRTVKASTAENKSKTESTKIPKRSPSPRTVKASTAENKSKTESKIPKRSPSPRTVKASTTETKSESKSKKPKRSPSPRTVKASSTENKSKTEPEKPIKSPSHRNVNASSTENKDTVIALPEKRKRTTRAIYGFETEASKKNITAKDDCLNSPQTKNKINQLLNHSNEKEEKSKALNNDNPSKSSLRTRTSKPGPKSTQPTETPVEIKKPVANKSNRFDLEPPKIIVTDENNHLVQSKHFDTTKSVKRPSLSRKRSQTSNPKSNKEKVDEKTEVKAKSRAQSADAEKSKYFDSNTESVSRAKKPRLSRNRTNDCNSEDSERVSHRDLVNKISPKKRVNDITGDLIDIVKKSIRQEKEESRKGLVKGKAKLESDDDSDYMPVMSPHRDGESDDDFKPTKISPRPSTSTKGRKLDRRVISSDEDTPKNKTDVWCEIFVEELEQWVAVDVIRGKVHCASEIYKNATHPVCYIVGWDNNNYLKDLTRRYVPHWNTVTRKQRAEPTWWDKAVQPWLGPKSPRDREEDDQLNRMQLEAPLPTSIGEYKNHPLYALKRHLLKFEAIYPPDAAVLGFVRKEPVYARECVYVCRSRDTWLKEAKVVRLGETPYKVVKARPKWDRLSNKLITDKPLEVFGPWQVQDYEPPVAENGLVPRNAYGNVELFKACMLPKGTVHVKLPGLNRVCKKLNIDCAPAMTGFDFNGGWSHPVYDGFVVCQEFEEIVTQAWLEDQEEQERKEREKLDARVYGNWKRLIKGLLIRERVKLKYGFEDPAPSTQDKKKKGPRFVAKKK